MILEIARVAGETAPILFTGAVYFSSVADSGVDKLGTYSTRKASPSVYVSGILAGEWHRMMINMHSGDRR